MTQKLGWIDLQSQRRIAKGTLVYKLNGLTPDYLTQIFTECSRIAYYTLRAPDIMKTR